MDLAINAVRLRCWGASERGLCFCWSGYGEFCSRQRHEKFTSLHGLRVLVWPREFWVWPWEICKIAWSASAGQPTTFFCVMLWGIHDILLGGFLTIFVSRWRLAVLLYCYVFSFPVLAYPVNYLLTAYAPTSSLYLLHKLVYIHSFIHSLDSLSLIHFPCTYSLIKPLPQ